MKILMKNISGDLIEKLDLLPIRQSVSRANAGHWSRHRRYYSDKKYSPYHIGKRLLKR